MRLSAHGDQRLDPCRLAGRHIPRAEIAGISQQRFGLAVVERLTQRAMQRTASLFMPKLPSNRH
jgi:hypothetical protein